MAESTDRGRLQDEEDKRAMREDIRRLWQDLGRLRDWKDRLEERNTEISAGMARLREENLQLTDALTASRTENDALRRRYQGVWQEKVVLQEQLAGSPLLPLDILLHIAEIIAGANHFGTLLNFGLMNKAIFQETMPIRFETVILDERFKERFKTQRKPHPPEWQFTKYVFVGSVIPIPQIELYFPNVRIYIVQEPCTSGSEIIKVPGIDTFAQLKAAVIFVDAVQADTLTSLLQYPLRWLSNDGARKLPITYPIQGVSRLVLEANGALLPSNSELDGWMCRNFVSTFEIHTRKVQPLHATPAMFQELFRFAPVMPLEGLEQAQIEGSLDNFPRLFIMTQAESGMDAWIEFLASALTRQPLSMIRIGLDNDINRARFQAHLLSAAAMYGRIWRQIHQQIKSNLPMAWPFFSMVDTSYQAGLLNVLEGRLSLDPSLGDDVFTIQVSALADRGGGDETEDIIFFERFTVPGEIPEEDS